MLLLLLSEECVQVGGEAQMQSNEADLFMTLQPLIEETECSAHSGPLFTFNDMQATLNG